VKVSRLTKKHANVSSRPGPVLEASTKMIIIFNADESGLYFRALPQTTLAFTSEKRREVRNHTKCFPLEYTPYMAHI